MKKILGILAILTMFVFTGGAWAGGCAGLTGDCYAPGTSGTGYIGVDGWEWGEGNFLDMNIDDDLVVTDDASVGGDTTLTGTLTVNGASIAGDGATAITGYVESAEIVTATNVLTAAECGKVQFLTSGTEFATTLPALSTVSAGCRMRFIVGAAPSGASYTVVTGNSLENKIYGMVLEAETDTGDDGPLAADEDTITFVDGVAVKGDWVEVISNGTEWFVSGMTAADGGVTLTQAD